MDWEGFPVQDQTVNILGFEVHVIFVELAQLWQCSAKAGIDKTLFTKTNSGPDLT